MQYVIFSLGKFLLKLKMHASKQLKWKVATWLKTKQQILQYVDIYMLHPRGSEMVLLITWWSWTPVSVVVVSRWRDIWIRRRVQCRNVSAKVLSHCRGSSFLSKASKTRLVTLKTRFFLYLEAGKQHMVESRFTFT